MWYGTEKLSCKRDKCTPAAAGAGGFCSSSAQAVHLTAMTNMGSPPGLHQGASLLKCWPLTRQKPLYYNHPPLGSSSERHSASIHDLHKSQPPSFKGQVLELVFLVKSQWEKCDFWVLWCIPGSFWGSTIHGSWFFDYFTLRTNFQ